MAGIMGRFLQIFAQSVMAASVLKDESFCPSALFVFGDSLSDTGNDAVAFPRGPSYENFHYGQTYFGHFSGRASDGRLLVDFAAQAFRFPLLTPYVQAIGANYQHGVNFAWRGATARATSFVTPFHLSNQVDQFLSFQKSVVTAATSNSLQDSITKLPAVNDISNALFFIHIGINDFWQNLAYNNMNLQQIKATIVPDVVQTLTNAIQNLHSYGGAKKFMVVNVPAIGCLPMFLSNYGTGKYADYDTKGCLSQHNNVVRLYNQELKEATKRIGEGNPDISIIYADYFQIHEDVMANATAYGFRADKKLTACCGGGGGYGVPVMPCRYKNTSVCQDPSGYISWDGIHFTEAFSKLVATSLLKGNYLDPFYNMAASCTLDV